MESQAQHADKAQKNVSLPEAGFLFDDSRIQEGVHMSADRRTVTKTFNSNAGVFGNVLFSVGRYSWKFRLGSLQNSSWVAIGVAPTKGDDRSVGWGISSRSQRFLGLTTGGTTASGDWEDGDIIRVDLDCDEHEVTITNERTGRSETIMNLPAVPLMPWVNLCAKGNSITLL
eukprot:TRINITY_DN7424_c0_g1_i1.p1 TRINITY_DN7424_c0_g1~~TRINITY_DN7424_c0_g1_i1.p1  ORF type:complete len:172 (+),score=26.31 TRINITY_DN7424_c0_g1_i1:117-632(+)